MDKPHPADNQVDVGFDKDAAEAAEKEWAPPIVVDSEDPRTTDGESSSD